MMSLLNTVDAPTMPEDAPKTHRTAHRCGAERKGRALLVEDEPLLRHHVAQLLEHRGFEVDQASETAGALHMLAREDYDLVITDLLLPRGSGLEVVKRACTCDRPPTVVVITGYLSTEVGREALLAGAADFLEKPFTRERLFSALPQA